MQRGDNKRKVSGGGGGGGGTTKSTPKGTGNEESTSRTTSAVELLSDEILCAIFGFLDDGIDLCAVGQVNHFWHRLAQDDSLWKGLAVKRGWRLPAELPGGETSPEDSSGSPSSSNGQRSSSGKTGGKQRSKELQRQRGRPSMQRSKADDSYLTKGRAVDDDGARNRQGGGDHGGEGGDRCGGQWKEWYVQTLHRRVRRSMRECEGDEEEARWRHVTEDDGQHGHTGHESDDEEGGADGSEDENDDSDDGAGDGGDSTVGKGKTKGKEREDWVMAKRRARGKRETDQRIGSGPLKATVSSREDFLQLVKEKAVRSLTKVEIREQEVVLAQFAWDTPIQQFGANKDDLYIVGGTPWGLVNYMLTELSSFDDPMVSQFLLTHQSFMSSTEVLRMLKEYLCIMPRGYSRDYQLLWRKHKLEPVQNMVVHVLKSWIKEQPCHFRTDPVLAAHMQEFLESHLTFHPLEKAFQQLLQLAKKLARQMALLAWDLFAQLPHDELLDMRWKHQASSCPNVRQLVDFFNMVAGHVATTVVTERSMKQRVKLLEKWVDVANHSFKIQDLTSTLAIVSGLGCAAVHRLKKTQQCLSKSTVKTLEALTKTSTRRRLRALSETMTPPGVPYLGMHLVDLSFVSDGYTPFLSLDWGDKTCVHWYYHCMNALVIKDIYGLTKNGFHFKRDPALIETLCSLPYLSSEDAYRQSLTVDETIEQ